MRIYLSDAFFEFGGSPVTCWIYSGNEKFKVRVALKGFSVYRYRLRDTLESSGRGSLLKLAKNVVNAVSTEKTENKWDLVGCMSFGSADRVDNSALSDGTMVRSWDNTVEPPVRIEVGECAFRPSSWPSFRFQNQRRETWIVTAEGQVGMKVDFRKEDRQTVRKVLSLSDVDRFSLGTLVEWREVLWRRYGTKIGFWLEREIDAKIKEHADDTCDSIRFCDVSDSWERAEFNSIRSCCMSYETLLEHDSGTKFRIGFNYGH